MSAAQNCSPAWSSSRNTSYAPRLSNSSISFASCCFELLLRFLLCLLLSSVPRYFLCCGVALAWSFYTFPWAFEFSRGEKQKSGLLHSQDLRVVATARIHSLSISRETESHHPPFSLPLRIRSCRLAQYLAYAALAPFLELGVCVWGGSICAGCVA